jgi:hypothetical protein
MWWEKVWNIQTDNVGEFFLRSHNAKAAEIATNRKWKANLVAICTIKNPIFRMNSQCIASTQTLSGTLWSAGALLESL